MFTQTQMQGLPYRADAPQYPFLPISPGNAPYVPRNTGLPVEFENQYMALIASTVAIEIQRTATANPLRMFMYNQCAENNFQNQTFDSLCVGIAEYVFLYTFIKRAYPSPEQAIQAAVPELVQIWCGVNVRSFPALQQVIDAATYQGVQSTVAMFDQLTAELTAAKTGAMGGQGMAMQSQAGMAMGWGGGQQGWGGQGGMQQTWTNYGSGPMGGGGQVGWSGRFGNVNQNQRPGPARSMIFNNPGPGIFRGNPGGKPVGRYDVPSEVGGPPASSAPPASREISFAPPAPPAVTQPPAASAPAITPAPPAPAAQPQVREVPAIGNWHLWNTSAQSRYLPVYDPQVHELYFEIDDTNKTVKPILKQRNTTVDYDKHSTATLGAVPPGMNLESPQKTLQRLQEGARQLDAQRGKALPEAGEGEAPPQVAIDEGTLPAMSKGSAIFQGLVLRLSQNRGDIPDVFCTFARVAEPVLTLKDESGLIEKYANAGSFAKVREMLQADVNNITPALWTTYNNKLTKAVNRALALNLSIPTAALNIDSFAMDINDLVEVLGNTYGDAVKSAFMNRQQDILQSCFLPMFEEDAQAFTESFFSDQEFGEVRPHVNYNCSDFSLTYLNCHAHELGLELAPGVGSVVQAENMGQMHAILTALFKGVDARPDKVERNLIITNDGRTLEASRGWLMPDAYVLMLVK